MVTALRGIGFARWSAPERNGKVRHWRSASGLRQVIVDGAARTFCNSAARAQQGPGVKAVQEHCGDFLRSSIRNDLPFDACGCQHQQLGAFVGGVRSFLAQSARGKLVDSPLNDRARISQTAANLRRCERKARLAMVAASSMVDNSVAPSTGRNSRKILL